MSNQDTNIKEYIERFFEAEAGTNWDLVHELSDQFGLSYVDAYRYISAYLSNKWAVAKTADEELLEDLHLEQLEQMG